MITDLESYKFDKMSNSEKIVQSAHDLAAQIVSGEGAMIQKEMRERSGCKSGCVRLIGKELVVRRPDLFVEIGKIATFFEVYSRSDGNIQIDFTFNKLT